MTKLKMSHKTGLVCPACGGPVTAGQKGAFIVAGCHDCDWWTGPSDREEFALEKAFTFISKFPLMLRVVVGDELEYFKTDGLVLRGKVIKRGHSTSSAPFVVVRSLDGSRTDLVYTHDVLSYPWDFSRCDSNEGVEED